MTALANFRGEVSALDAVTDTMADATDRLVSADIIRGTKFYRRSQHLPELLRVYPAELADESRAGTLAIVARLRLAVEGAERALRKGHWASDPNRVVALRQALYAEEQQLEKLLTWGRR